MVCFGSKLALLRFLPDFALAAFFGSTLAKEFFAGIEHRDCHNCWQRAFCQFRDLGQCHAANYFRHNAVAFDFADSHRAFGCAGGLIWLSYLNFNHFQESKRLWRRNVLGISGALLFVIIGSALIYNRAWEIFEPAEPPHGAAKFSLQNPPKVRANGGITDVAAGWPGVAGLRRNQFQRQIQRHDLADAQSNTAKRRAGAIH